MWASLSNHHHDMVRRPFPSLLDHQKYFEREENLHEAEKIRAINKLLFGNEMRRFIWQIRNRKEVEIVQVEKCWKLCKFFHSLLSLSRNKNLQKESWILLVYFFSSTQFSKKFFFFPFFIVMCKTEKIFKFLRMKKRNCGKRFFNESKRMKGEKFEFEATKFHARIHSKISWLILKAKLGI